MEADSETHVHYLRTMTEIHRAIEIIDSLLLTSTSELGNEISPAFKVRLRMVVVGYLLFKTTLVCSRLI